MVCKTILQDQVTAWFKENICDLEPKEQILPEEDRSVRRKSLFRIDIPTATTAAATSTPATPASKGDVWTGISRMQWLASLLGVARADVLSHLASLSSRSGRLEEAIQICQ